MTQVKYVLKYNNLKQDTTLRLEWVVNSQAYKVASLSRCHSCFDFPLPCTTAKCHIIILRGYRNPGITSREVARIHTSPLKLHANSSWAAEWRQSHVMKMNRSVREV